MQAREQQATTDVQADAFFARFPAATLNDSAQQIDRLGAALGFSPNARYLDPVDIDPVAAADFQAIDPVLTRFLQEQTILVSGPLELLPADLSTYLNTYRSKILSAQEMILAGDLPQWDLTVEALFDPTYPSPGFFNVLYLQKLILLSAVEYHHQGQRAQMLSAMDASWRLNQAIAQRPDLVSQLLSSLVLAQQASLLRHLEAVPADWQARLASHSPQRAILTGLRFEGWLKYKVLQSTWSVRRPSGAFSSQLSEWFSMRSYFKLKAITTANTTHAALDWLATTDVCSMPQSVVERRLETLQVSEGGAETAFSSAAIARRWKSAGDRALAIELSQHVLAAKQQRLEQGMWPTTLPDLDSQICPGERWVYELTGDTMTLSLSKQLVTGAAVPLRYAANR